MALETSVMSNLGTLLNVVSNIQDLLIIQPTLDESNLRGRVKKSELKTCVVDCISLIKVAPTTNQMKTKIEM